MGFSRQEYCSGLPCPPPGDLPDPGIEPASPASPALPGVFFSADPLEKPLCLGPSVQFETDDLCPRGPKWTFEILNNHEIPNKQQIKAIVCVCVCMCTCACMCVKWNDINIKEMILTCSKPFFPPPFLFLSSCNFVSLWLDAVCSENLLKCKEDNKISCNLLLEGAWDHG